MAESIKHSYKPLCEVHLLHHYWLDDNGTVFDAISDSAKKNRHLQNYDYRRFLSVIPTTATQKNLHALDCIFKDTALGFIIAAPSTQIIPADILLEFIVTVSNADFFNYTALTLLPQKITELYYQTEDKMLRFKENVPVLSNLTGAVRGSGGNKSLFLSGKYLVRHPNDRIESLVIAGGGLEQLTSDPPSPSTQQLAASADDLPIFVHQGDIPTITAPTGLTGVPERGIQLSDDIPDNVFALIRLAPIRADDKDFSMTGNNGVAKNKHPVFQIRFKNRSTIRRYINKQTGIVTETGTTPLPLTHFRNPKIVLKPAPFSGGVKMEKSGKKITRLISEIFV